MKKTFSNFRTLAALLMAGAAFAACSSDNDIIEQQPAVNPGDQVYTLTVNATKDGGSQTRALKLDGEKLVASWQTGDRIYVIKVSPYSSVGYLNPTNISADGNSATLTGEVTGVDVYDDLILTYHYHNISDFANQNGLLKDHANSAEEYDMAEATVTVASVNGTTITTTADASFETKTAMIKFTLQDNAATPNKINATSLNVKATITLPSPLSGSITEDIFTFTPNSVTYTENGDGILYFALPSAATLAGPIATKLQADPYNLTTITESDVKTLLASATVTFTASDGTKTYNATKTGYPFAAGSYYTSTLTMVPAVPTGAIDGKFSIDGSHQVYFSRGNLQATYDGSSWSWAFADNQWDYIGNATGNTKVTDSTPFISENATVDLFGWVGNTSTWTGAAMYGITSSTTTSAADGYGNNTSDALKSDWGTLAITNGGNTANSGWRTLTSDEWAYVFNTRTVNGGTGSGHSYTLGQSVNGKLGIVIYPDDYTGSEYSGSDWASFEAAGCVFLPAAGYRHQSTVWVADSKGYYWSSSPNTPSYAFCVWFDTGGPNLTVSILRSAGCSVRLVRPVE